MLHTILPIAAVAASFLFVIPPVLQIIKIINQKSAQAVAISSFILSFFCLFIWVLYGISICNLPVIITSSLEMAANLATIVTIIFFRTSRRSLAVKRHSHKVEMPGSAPGVGT